MRDLSHDNKSEAVAVGPSLSVVVVTFAGSSYLRKCLQALSAQTNVQELEIIVPCDERVSDLHALQGKFPKVRFVTIGGQRTFAELRALGVANARGAVIALTEDHCTPNPDWCERILEAHRGSYAVAGGAVEKATPDTALSWALYLSDYSRYMNPRPEGYASELTDCNVSYKRSALNTVAEVWQLEFHEPAVHSALRASGQSLWFSPKIVVYQQRTVRFNDAVRDRYAFGRLFGSGRAGAVSTGRRLFYAMICFLLPPLLVGRVAQHVFRRGRHLGIFVRSLPMLIVLNSAWAWGEFLGYVTGRSDISLTPQAQGVNAQSQARATT